VPLSRNLGALTSWNPLGLFRLVMGLLYLYLLPFPANLVLKNFDFVLMTLLSNIIENDLESKVHRRVVMNSA